MKPIDFSVNAVVRKDRIKISNMAKLGEYVQAHVTDEMFTMEFFYKKLYGQQRDAHGGCDTIGCLLGYSPMALGVELQDTHIVALIKYSQFSGRHFNMTAGKKVYQFLFDMHWYDIDNSRQGALQRIKFVIDHDDFDYGETDYARWYELIRQRMPLFN